MSNQERITRPELNAMAKERGMNCYLKLSRFELAERLGIELPRPRLKPRWKPKKEERKVKRKPREEERKPRRARRVEAVNPDGTTTVYPSISTATQVLRKYPMQIYVVAARGYRPFVVTEKCA